MHVRGLAVPVRVLAVVLCRGSVLLRFIVIAMIVIMGSLAVVMRRRFMLRGSIVMMLAGLVLLFLCHGKILLQNEIHDVSGRNARLTAVTNFTAGNLAFAAVRRHSKRKKPAWLNTLRYSTTPAYLLTGHQAQRRVAFHLVCRLNH
jgi:hypothetical protein